MERRNVITLDPSLEQEQHGDDLPRVWNGGGVLADWFRCAGTWMHYVSLLAALPFFLHLSWHHWFFGDDWDFLVRRGIRGAELGIFEPHNEHWSTAPILIFRTLFHFFGARTYLPYVAVVLVLHLAAAHLVWRLMRQTDTPPWVATALACTFLLGGAGAENFMWSFQIGFVGALAFGLFTLVLANHPAPSRGRECAAAGTAVFSLLWAGVAVPLVATAGILAWMRRGWRAALRLTAPAALVYIVWLELWGKAGLRTHPVTARGLLLVPSYSWRGLVTTVQGYTIFEDAGPVLLLVLAYVLLVKSDWASSKAAIASAGFLGAIVLFLTVAPARVAQGVEQADAARYHYTAWALFLPSIGVCLKHLIAGDRGRRMVVLAVISGCALRGTDLLLKESRVLELRGQDHRRMITAAAELSASGDAVFPVPPHRVHAPDLAPPNRMVTLLREGALRRSRNLSEADRLRAMVGMQLQLPPYANLAVADPPLVIVETVRRGTMISASGGCATIRPQEGRPEVELAILGPTAIRVTTVLGGELRVLVHDPATGFTVDPDAVMNLAPQTPASFDVAITRAHPLLLLPVEGDATVCGVRLSSTG
jgi:hypothetical protein